MTRNPWTSGATTAALILALIPLVLPGGMAVSLCLSTDRLQLHAPGVDACGGCGPAAADGSERGVTSEAEPSSCCSSRHPPATPADRPGSHVDDADHGADCGCCVELAKTDKDPGKPLESQATPTDLPDRRVEPFQFVAQPASTDVTVPCATGPPPRSGGAFVAPLLI